MQYVLVVDSDAYMRASEADVELAELHLYHVSLFLKTLIHCLVLDYVKLLDNYFFSICSPMKDFLLNS